MNAGRIMVRILAKEFARTNLIHLALELGMVITLWRMEDKIDKINRHL